MPIARIFWQPHFQPWGIATQNQFVMLKDEYFLYFFSFFGRIIGKQCLVTLYFE